MPLLSCAGLAALIHTTAAPGFPQAGHEWQVHKLLERCPHSQTKHTSSISGC